MLRVCALRGTDVGLSRQFGHVAIARGPATICLLNHNGGTTGQGGREREGERGRERERGEEEREIM